ncbi:MAG TPA: hypothetical protein VF607_08395 [Verrucomicrobiae bacterium]
MIIATAVVAIVFGGIINCYIQAGNRIEWSGYSLAAQSLANQNLEQLRAANWDPTIAVNNLTNMNLSGGSYDSSTRTYTGYSTGILDIPYSGTNYTMVTNYITVQLVYVNGVSNVQMQFLRVDTVWPFFLRKLNLYFTNTVSTMVAPDDRQI